MIKDFFDSRLGGFILSGALVSASLKCVTLASTSSATGIWFGAVAAFSGFFGLLIFTACIIAEK